jgi:hypothetical protein
MKLGVDQMENNFLAKLLNMLVTLFLILLIITFFTLPFLVDEYMKTEGVQLTSPFALKLFLYLTAFPFFTLLVMVKKLCKNVLQNQAFSRSSITALNCISVCAFIDFFLYIIGTFIFLRNLLSLTLMIAAFMIGLVGLILAQLMKIALELKEENDLTI